MPRLVISTLVALALAASASGCARWRASHPRTSHRASTGAESEQPTPPERDAAAPPAPVVTTGLPPEAAHPSIAWLLSRERDIPNVPLGATANTDVDALHATAFVAHRATSEIVPRLFRSRHLPLTASTLARAELVDGAASLARARTLVRDAEVQAQAEAALIGDYSDRANAEGAAREAFAVLGGLLDDLEAKGRAPSSLIDDRTLAPWHALFEVMNDDDAIELREACIADYVAFLKTSHVPRGTRRAAQNRFVHPAIRAYLAIAAERLPLSELAILLGVDATDTLRGRNTDVHLLGADAALRVVAPRVLDLCGAREEAAMLRALRPIRDQRALEAATDLFGGMGGPSHPNRLCIEAAQNMAEPVAEANRAFSYQRTDINGHPYYARSAIVGWAAPFGFFVERGVDPKQVRQFAVALLEAFVSDVKRLPRRRETSREPRD